MDRETAVRNGFKLKNSSEFENIGVSRDLIMADRIEARANFIRKKQQNQGTAQTVTLQHLHHKWQIQQQQQNQKQHPSVRKKMIGTVYTLKGTR